jgi:hypothetical protein
MACAIGLPNVRKRRAAELADDAGIREFSAAIVSFRPDRLLQRIDRCH